MIELVRAGLTVRGRPLVDDVTASFGPGEVVVLAGPNGAGKSMLLRMLLGLAAPTSGRVTVDGMPPSSPSVGATRLFGTVGQPAFYDWRSPRANLKLLVDLSGGRPAIDVSEALGRVGLAASQRAGRLSMGERQRLNLALVYCMHPWFLVLDEPTNGLDTGGIDLLLDHLSILASDGRTAIVATHQTGVFQDVATRCLVLQSGRLVDDSVRGQWRERSVEAHCRGLVRERGSA